MSIVTELPSWYIILCILLGAGYAGVLYFRDNSFPELDKRIKWLMASFRFAVVTLLAVLLLSPLIKTIHRETEKPIVVLAEDNSQSLVTGKDSAFCRKELPGRMEALAKKLEEKYEVKRFSFGDQVQDMNSFLSLSFDQKQTDISSLFDELQNRFSNRNLGAVVVASDGLFNRGANPVYSSEKLKVPVYTIALGDTSIQRDLAVSKVNYNKTAFLGNDFPLEILVEAKKCSGSETRLTVMEDSAVLVSRMLTISTGNYHSSEHVVLTAKSKGMHHYKISLSPVENEATVLNNKGDVFIEVLESKEKVLILADAPHPDLSAIRQALESGSHYEVKIAFADKFDGNVSPYNLVILHQLPSLKNAITTITAKIIQAKIPAWFILGSQSNLSNFNSIQPGMNISANLNRMNDALPGIKNDFSLFTLNPETVRKLNRFPPLQVIYATYKTSPGTASFLEQQIGQVKTGNPMLTFFPSGDSRMAVLTGEGLWRWNLHDFSENNNHEAFNELILKTVQYLSVKEEKVPLRVSHKNTFAENEPVLFDSELHNESYELINEPDIHLVIVNHEGKNFPYTFGKTDRTYTLNAGFFPPGSYKYDATVKLGEKALSAKGEFSVRALQAEFAETSADFGLLYLLAKKHGGEMAGSREMDQIASLLSAREDVKPVIYSENKLSELVNLKWVFFLLLALLSAEWFLRKRSGAY